MIYWKYVLALFFESLADWANIFIVWYWVWWFWNVWILVFRFGWGLFWFGFCSNGYGCSRRFCCDFFRRWCICHCCFISLLIVFKIFFLDYFCIFFFGVMIKTKFLNAGLYFCLCLSCSFCLLSLESLLWHFVWISSSILSLGYSISNKKQSDYVKKFHYFNIWNYLVWKNWLIVEYRWDL